MNNPTDTEENHPPEAIDLKKQNSAMSLLLAACVLKENRSRLTFSPSEMVRAENMRVKWVRDEMTGVVRLMVECP